MRRSTPYISVFLLLLLLVVDADASWVSDITGIDINVPKSTITFGPPRPDRIPMMLQNLPKDVVIFFLNPLAGSALAYAIREAKESARKVCVPIPPTVTMTLASFFPNDFFDGVCWAVVGNGFSLDSYAIHDAGMAAITLEDVVVFKSAQDGYDPVLWAHELTRVRQYQSLGVEGFAALYTVAWDTMEQQARDFDQFVARSLQAASSNRQYWVTASGWNASQQISFQQYANYARQSVNPTQCSSYTDGREPDGPYYTEVRNSCPIPITVTAISKLFFNGSRDQRVCQNCTIGPGDSRKFPSTGDSQTTAVSVIW